MLKHLYHSRSEESLRNGSFIVERRSGNLPTTYAVFLLGDFVAFVPSVSEGLLTWPYKEAKLLLPAVFRGR